MRLAPAWRAVAYAGALSLGAVTGVLGSFGHRREVEVLGADLPVGLLLALAGPAVLIALVRLAGGGRVGAGLAFGGWVAACLVLSVQRPEGDLVLVADAFGYAFLFGGLAVCLVALTWPWRV